MSETPATRAPLAAVAPARTPRPRGSARSRGFYAIENLFYFVALAVVWEGIVRLCDVPTYLFPAPSAIALALYHGLASGTYLRSLGVTLSEIVGGFAAGSVFGIALGIAIATIPVLNRVLYPYVVAIQTVPKVAVAPLMIIWFGFGIQSKIIIVALTCMFPVLINTISGMHATESDRIALVRAMGGSKFQLLRYIQLPSALPYIFAGLNTGIVLAVIGAIVGEFVGARSGIGVLILQANFALDIASVFALLLLLSLSGVSLNLVTRWAEKKVCFWSGKSTK
jgi:NitT/TauT family transport system permease protein